MHHAKANKPQSLSLTLYVAKILQNALIKVTQLKYINSKR